MARSIPPTLASPDKFTGTFNVKWSLVGDQNILPATTASPSETATFSLQAVGPGPLSHQWYREEFRLPGENTDTFATADVKSLMPARTMCWHSNEYGTRVNPSAV